MAASRRVPRPFTMHWGSGVIAEEASFSGEWSDPAIQLLEYSDGEAAGSLTIRFCSFNHSGLFQRSPLMLQERDLQALREALAATPRLRALLSQLVESPIRDTIKPS